MKLSNVFAKLTWKSKVVRIAAATTLAGAMFAAAAPAVQAQRVFIGAHIGGPYHFVPAPPPPRFYGYRHDDWRFRHDDWRYRHDDWRFHHGYYR